MAAYLGYDNINTNGIYSCNSAFYPNGTSMPSTSFSVINTAPNYYQLLTLNATGFMNTSNLSSLSLVWNCCSTWLPQNCNNKNNIFLILIVIFIQNLFKINF